jgi:hypothetical protein
MKRKVKGLMLLNWFLGLLLVISVFKNISYPLFWADESFTAMGSERVIKYGYPKAHDGKNVINDMRCNDPDKAVNEKYDAYIGGASWGQYYFGVIGYLLASHFNNLYTQTGIYRFTFALIGLVGLLLFVILMTNFFDDKFYEYLFIALFLLAELISVSLILHLRQVRYYPLTFFFSLSIISLYVLHRFHRQFNSIFYSVGLAILLWIQFNVFSPLYYVFILAIAISEVYLFVSKYRKVQKLKDVIIPYFPTMMAILVASLGVLPLFEYFKTFEIKKMLDDYYGFNFAKYWLNLSTEIGYFSKFELFWLAIAMKVGIFINIKEVIKQDFKLFRVSNFLVLLFIVAISIIPDADTAIFTRYYINMQPVLVCFVLFDFILLLKLFFRTSEKIKNKKRYLLIAVFTLLFGFTFVENLPYLGGHIYEMEHQYKGPLDYAIPYIKSNYDKPEDLTIATNYEETSFMYYLHSKVIVGYVGNNLQEDTSCKPQIIFFRESKGSPFVDVFDYLSRKAVYNRINFQAKDIPLNNSPELNFYIPEYNHYFKSVITENNDDNVRMDIRI